MFNKKFNIFLFFVIIFSINIDKLYATKASFLRWGYCVDSSLYSEKYLNQICNRYDVLCLTGFRISCNTKILYPVKKQYSKISRICKKNRKLFIPLITFSTVKDGKKILKSHLLRNRVIKNIKKMIQKEKFPVIHFDLEYYSPDYTKYLALFFKQLKLNINVILSMAVFPQVDFPEKIRKFHNLKVLAPYLDEIVLMCYDYHNRGTAPGPVTDINWCIKNINYVKTFIHTDKIYLGIPAYGYLWSSDNKFKVISSRKGRTIIKNKKITRHKSGCVFYSFKKKNINYHLYFSDTHTIKRLEKLVYKYELKGIALWRLGFE